MKGTCSNNNEADEEEDSSNIRMEEVVEEQVTQLEAPASPISSFASTFASANPPTDSRECSYEEDDDEQTLNQLSEKAENFLRRLVMITTLFGRLWCLNYVVQ